MRSSLSVVLRNKYVAASNWNLMWNTSKWEVQKWMELNISTLDQSSYKHCKRLGNSTSNSSMRWTCCAWPWDCCLFSWMSRATNLMFPKSQTSCACSLSLTKIVPTRRASTWSERHTEKLWYNSQVQVQWFKQLGKYTWRLQLHPV